MYRYIMNKHGKAVHFQKLVSDTIPQLWLSPKIARRLILAANGNKPLRPLF